MIDSILVGGHEAEMAALEELERSEEMRLLSQQLAARDLRSAAWAAWAAWAAADPGSPGCLGCC